MAKNKKVIRLELATSDGKTGWQWVNDPDNERITWDEEPEGETLSARFQAVAEDGRVLDEVTINGDDWRSIDAEGALALVRRWYDRGVPLSSCVQSAVYQEDPPGRSSEYEDDIRELKAQIQHLEAERDRLTMQLYGMPSAQAAVEALFDHLDRTGAFDSETGQTKYLSLRVRREMASISGLPDSREMVSYWQDRIDEMGQQDTAMPREGRR